MSLRPALAAVLAAALGCLSAAPSAAACRHALVLALDISASVDPTEYVLQKEGLARALVAPEIAALLLEWPEAPVALHVFQWSNTPHQSEVLPWTLIDSPGTLAAAAAKIAGQPRGGLAGRTALGAAIAHAGSLFAHGPDCARRTVDISGDGRNNVGPEPLVTGAALAGVTINALVIGGGLRLDHADEVAGERPLAEYFRAEVIRGPGAFIEIADDYTDFERAMRRKLMRELGHMVIGRAPDAPR